MFIKIDDNTYIDFNDDVKTAQVIFKKEMEDKVTSLSVKIPSDDELLVWAKENYPGIKIAQENIIEASKIQDKLDFLDKATSVSDMQASTVVTIKK